jgi:hypothetical protein
MNRQAGVDICDATRRHTSRMTPLVVLIEGVEEFSLSARMTPLASFVEAVETGLLFSTCYAAFGVEYIDWLALWRGLVPQNRPRKRGRYMVGNFKACVFSALTMAEVVAT